MTDTSNDNYYLRKVDEGDLEDLPFVPLARYLIKKYVSEYWKNDINCPDYIFSEQRLCRYLSMRTPDIYAKQLQMTWLARQLQVEALTLYNDALLTSGLK